MGLGDILAADSVLFCPKVRDKAALLKVLADRAAKVTRQDPAAVYQALAAREALGSTGLGDGIAVPHGKLAGLSQVTAVFARLGQAIDFDAVDDQKVDLAMALLAPAGAGADHLKALARVARLLRVETLVEDLRATEDCARLYALLTVSVTSQHAA